MKALVIDDSRAIRSVISRMLRELGFQVVEAGNGQEGLTALATPGPIPNVALVDWNMPVMDGYQFVCAVRKDPRYHGMRIMMVTTETEIERMQMALAAGATEYLMKPFTKDAVAAKLAIMGVPLAA